LVKTGDILIALHVYVDQVTFAKVVHTALEQVVLDKALLHQHAIVSFHIVVGVIGEVVLFLAELDSFANAEYQVTFFPCLLAHFQ